MFANMLRESRLAPIYIRRKDDWNGMPCCKRQSPYVSVFEIYRPAWPAWLGFRFVTLVYECACGATWTR